MNNEILKMTENLSEIYMKCNGDSDITQSKNEYKQIQEDMKK